MTKSASKVATMLAVTQGSFKKAKETLSTLECGNLSVSMLRKETLHIGEEMLAGLRTPEKDLRQYSEAKLHTPHNKDLFNLDKCERRWN